VKGKSSEGFTFREAIGTIVFLNFIYAIIFGLTCCWTLSVWGFDLEVIINIIFCVVLVLIILFQIGIVVSSTVGYFPRIGLIAINSWTFSLFNGWASGISIGYINDGRDFSAAINFIWIPILLIAAFFKRPKKEPLQLNQTGSQQHQHNQNPSSDLTQHRNQTGSQQHQFNENPSSDLTEPNRNQIISANLRVELLR